ncbi:MAG: ABC transporter permease [Lachnospiraceae bacterium]|nr:ABC transporter permease [Lachnospiraceae bacterium]
MLKYLSKRLVQSLIAILGITVIVFIVLNITGDPVTLMLPETASFEEIEAMRQKLGFNDPILVQYGRFLLNAVRGDFGLSYNYNQPALDVVLERVPATVTLTLAALGVSLLIGIPAGIISAVKRNTLTDTVIRSLALLGQCVPAFWLGIMMMLLFAVRLHWLPTSGFETWGSLVMPAFTLGLFTAATITRMLRSNMIEIMGREYIDVAKAKGLGAFVIIMKHAFKNAMSSIMTIIGMQAASLLGGAVITETVFAWPGIGRLLVQSINKSDFMVVEVIVLLIATAFVIINFIVDILYCVINPRIRLQ